MLQIRTNSITKNLYCFFEFLGKEWYAKLNINKDNLPEVNIYIVYGDRIDYAHPVYTGHCSKINERSLRFYITKFKQTYRSEVQGIEDGTAS